MPPTFKFVPAPLGMESESESPGSGLNILCAKVFNSIRKYISYGIDFVILIIIVHNLAKV